MLLQRKFLMRNKAIATWSGEKYILYVYFCILIFPNKQTFSAYGKATITATITADGKVISNYV